MCDYPKARRLVVYHDGFDDFRAWMAKLRIEEDLSDPAGALMPLLERVEMDTLTDRIGLDRMEAFVTKLRREEIKLLRRAAKLAGTAGFTTRTSPCWGKRTGTRPTRRGGGTPSAGVARRRASRRPTIPME